jgi:hypothetical protein
MRKLFLLFKNNLTKGIIVPLTLVLLSLSFIGLTNAQSLDNKGDDFIMAFMPNLSGSGYTVELHLTSDVNTIVTVEYPVNSPTFSTPVVVTPGTVSILTIPLTAATGWPSGAVGNNAIRAFADEEFICYMINRRQATSDAALALPIDVMNTEFIVMTYEGASHGSDKSEFVVYAGFDATTVTITPSVALVGGFPAGVPFNITLNRGEGFLAQGLASIGPNSDLTTTTISSDRPVGVTNGNLCTYVPPGNTACDHIFEVAQPLQTWGDEVLVANLPNRTTGTIYRVIVSEDNTNIFMDGVNVATINKNQFYETPRLIGDHIFTTDNTFYVGQFMTGQSGSGSNLGDPAMGNMIPSAQYLNNYTFSTVGGGQFAENYVTIIAEDADVTGGTIFLDGGVVPAGAFSPIGTSGFQASLQLIADGTHTTSSNGVHGITVEGYNSFDSYIYPGGALFKFIAPGEDLLPPICELIINGDQGFGTVTDNQPDDSGVFFVNLLPGSVNIGLVVDPFVPGDPVVTYTVSLIDPNQNGSGEVQATDGSGNTCSSIVELQGSGGGFDYMTIWAVSDDNDGKLYYYSLVVNASAFLNVEGDILGVQGGQDIEDIKIDDNGEFYFVNNVGTSTIYKFNFSLLDGDENTPVPAVLVGSTGLPSDPNVFSPEEISSLLFYGAPLEGFQSNLFGVGLASKKLYEISTFDGSVNEIATLNVAGDFRTDGMTMREGIVYLLKTNDTGGESELWKFDQFPSGDISYVRDIQTSGKVEALTAHPNGFLYASDMDRFFEISVTDNYIGYLADYTVDIEGMDFFFELEALLPVLPKLPFIPINVTEVTEDTQMPNEYSLSQNYPNPFNPSTVITYALPQAGYVTLTVFNLLGEKVATLANENMSAGTHSVEFNGSDLTSGLYIYSIVSNGFVHSRKMVLMK